MLRIQPALTLGLVVLCTTAGCASSTKSACDALRPGVDTVTGTLYSQARELPASPLPDVISDAVKLRATVVQAQHQIETPNVHGRLRTEAARMSRDLDTAKRELDRYISGIRQDGVGGYRGPSADTIEAVLTNADRVADEISFSCT
jgi:hypothetical protein